MDREVSISSRSSNSGFKTRAERQESLYDTRSGSTSSVKSAASFEFRITTRSPSKQWRRRGIDLSREDFRISSRWSSGERRSMINLRDAYREAAKSTTESVFKIFLKKEMAGLRSGVNSVKEVVTGMKRSWSRSNLSNIEATRSYSFYGSESNNGRAGSRSLQQRSQNKALHNVETNIHDRNNKPFTTCSSVSNVDSSLAQKADDNCRSIDEAIAPPLATPHKQTWDEHLKHDLLQTFNSRKPFSTRGRKRHFRMHNSKKTELTMKDSGQVERCIEPSDTSSSNDPVQSCYHASTIELKITNLALSDSASTGPPLLYERLGDIVSSTEFELNI